MKTSPLGSFFTCVRGSNFFEAAIAEATMLFFSVGVISSRMNSGRKGMPRVLFSLVRLYSSV